MSARECSHPPATAVSWLVRHAATDRATIVQARTWCDARDMGAKLLGTDRYQVTCERVEMVTT